MLVLGFVSLDAHFCLFYEKVNYCKIWDSIIKKNCYIIWQKTFSNVHLCF